jgi:hypothetical protein
MKMAISIDELKRDEKLQAQSIINNLDKIEADAKEYVQKLDVLEAKIDSVKSMEELHHVVAAVIELDREIGALLSRDTKVMEVIKLHIQNVPRSSAIVTLLDFLSDNSKILNTISAAKERIQEKKLYEVLSESEKMVAMNFIEDVRALKKSSDDLKLQKQDFTTRLEQADTLDEVTNIEMEINKKHHECEDTLANKVHYPQNEITSGLLIDFMNSNPQLKSILQSFDFDESLSDSVLHARGRLSLPSSGMK